MNVDRNSRLINVLTALVGLAWPLETTGDLTPGNITLHKRAHAP